MFDPRLRYAANQFHSASIPGNEKDRMVVILNSRLHRDQRIGKFVGSVGGVGSRRKRRRDVDIGRNEKRRARICPRNKFLLS